MSLKEVQRFPFCFLSEEKEIAVGLAMPWLIESGDSLAYFCIDYMFEQERERMKHPAFVNKVTDIWVIRLSCHQVDKNVFDEKFVRG